MTAVTPTNLQKMEFDPTGAPSRVTVVTGVLPAMLQVSSGSSATFQSVSLTALVDPTLAPGKFRNATATAALATIDANANAFPLRFRFSIDDVEATLDGQSGRIELRVDASAEVVNGQATIVGIAFQVTTLSIV